MFAKPLPTRVDDATAKKEKKKPKKKPAEKPYKDDTPKEFSRMMNRFTKVSNPAPTDDGKKKQQQQPQQQQGRKRKLAEAGESNDNKNDNKNKNAKKTIEVPKILPGERMSDFAARVDQALPFTGITKKSGLTSTDPKDSALRGLREDRQTRHERKLKRLQQGWREDEARIREKEEEAREERDAKEEELNEMWKQWEAEAGGPLPGAADRKKKGKSTAGKKKKKKSGDDSDVESESDDADPWAKLNRKKKAHASRPMNPLETVLAPPQNLVKPREIFKVHGMRGAKADVANVPAAAGSLRRREELASERKNIVEEYRKLMASRRG